MTITYWNIGKRINKLVLDNQRAEYGKQIVVSVARQLTVQYGRSFEESILKAILTSLSTENYTCSYKEQT